MEIKVKDRDEIWHEIQASIQRQKERAIDDILRKANPEKKLETFLTIKAIVDSHAQMSERWDRFLHNGKTESEERKEQCDAIGKQLKDVFGIDDIFSDILNEKKG